MRAILKGLLICLIASPGDAVELHWTPVGNPGNSCDRQPDAVGGTGCYGAVPYAYSIGAFEITNAQYAEFLNAKASGYDSRGLYNDNMSHSYPEHISGYGGITREGSAGGYSYKAIAGRENMPVNYVSFYDAMRFANWMNNGQGDGDTETGAYTLDYGVPEPSNGRTVVRNSGAKIALTSEDEWYKAAYYDATRKQYLKSPTGSSAWTKCKYPASSVPNTANCLGSLLQAVALTPVGSYRASRSPYGTFDQGGNAFEWNEAIVIMRCSNSSACGLQLRGRRGGSFEDAPVNLFSVQRGYTDPINEFTTMGFRLVMILSTPGPLR